MDVKYHDLNDRIHKRGVRTTIAICKISEKERYLTGIKPIMNMGVTAITTITVLNTFTMFARYDRPAATSCSSTVYKSLLNRLIILPVGVLLKSGWQNDEAENRVIQRKN